MVFTDIRFSVGDDVKRDFDVYNKTGTGTKTDFDFDTISEVLIDIRKGQSERSELVKRLTLTGGEVTTDGNTLTFEFNSDSFPACILYFQIRVVDTDAKTDSWGWGRMIVEQNITKL